MVDVVDRATRSRMMSGIRARNTKPEIALRSALHGLGLRFRINDRRLPGRPDIVLPRHRAVVQVHGCFWHRHAGCRYATTPDSNREFWLEKFGVNMERDERSATALRGLGWRIAVVWECAMKERGAHETAKEVCDWLASPEVTAEFPAQAIPSCNAEKDG